MAETMWALTFDEAREEWSKSTGLVKERIPVPRLEPGESADRSSVILKVKYAGFCGTDRGIWYRKSFGDLIHESLAEEGKTRRITGHELVGEIVEVGPRVGPKYGYKVGDVVSTESHIVCGTCYQCRHGESHVCAREKIIGISLDGGFAEYVKLPAKALWPTDLGKIRPEVAAIQEPFGNGVHACQVVDLSGKTVAIFGTGTIGMFAVLIARALGASKVIGVEPDPVNAAKAKRIGCDEVLTPTTPDPERPWQADPAVRERILDLTDGVGVDVAMEMAGPPASLNNAIKAARRGGHVILFGVRNGDMPVQDYHLVVRNGLTLHAVIGRRIFQTWSITQRLLEARDNGIQEAVWTHILEKGDGTVVPIEDWNRADFEQRINKHPKLVVRFAG